MLFLPYQADFTFWLDPKSKHEEGTSEPRLRPLRSEKLHDAG